jgi:hypothetical protein
MNPLAPIKSLNLNQYSILAKTRQIEMCGLPISWIDNSLAVSRS